MKILTFGFVLSVFATLTISLRVQARLPKESDLASIIESETAEYDIKKDGTYTIQYEARSAVLTEAGREALAVKTIGFNARASTFELLEAKTINGSNEIPVPRQNVEIKEVGDSKAFDANKQAIISYLSVQVGSKIILRYRIRFKEVPIVGFFSTGINVGLENVDKIKSTIRSDIPLSVSVSDTMGMLEVKSSQANGRSIVEVSNRTKIRLGVVQEDAAFLANGRLPSVIISTLPAEMGGWSGFAREIIQEQEKQMQAPLPEPMEKIKKQAVNESPERRMAVVSSLVAQDFRYFGDWRRRRGGHIPRPLQEIAETRYGDCKDMSQTVVAIARAMGLKADIAWIWRNEIFVDDTFYRLPNDYGFNHAIARVEDGGRVQWIDATNPVVLASGLPADIANRPALVMHREGARLDRTPAMVSSEAMTRVSLMFNIRRDGGVDLDGLLSHRGRSAVRSEWALLYLPREQIEYDAARWLARNEKLESYKVELPETPSRVVRNVDIKAKLSISDVGLRTTAGIGFPLLRNDTIDTLLVETADRFSDLWLGPPGRYEEEYRIQGASVVGKTNIGCDLKNQWVRLKRVIKSERGGRGPVTRVSTEYEIYESVVPNKALTAVSFSAFQKQVRECFHRAAVILSLPASAQSSTKSRSS